MRPSGRAPQDPVDGTDARGAVFVTEATGDESVSDLPREDVRVVLLVAQYAVHHHRRCHLIT